MTDITYYALESKKTYEYHYTILPVWMMQVML